MNTEIAKHYAAADRTIGQGPASITPELDRLANRIGGTFENIGGLHNRLLGIANRVLGAVPTGGSIGGDKAAPPRPSGAVYKLDDQLDGINQVLDMIEGTVSRLERL